MDYNITDKVNMSLQRLRQEQKVDFVNDLSESAEIIHRSLWALSIKDGLHVFKMYYYNDLEKINKEVKLMQNMGQIPVQLYKDTKDIYYSKSKYLELENISPDIIFSDVAKQLDYWCEYWDNQEEFILYASKDWKSMTVPYMMHMLTTYGDDATVHIKYLNGLQEEVFVHGDLTLDNVKKAGEQIVILDFETASVGPKLWDKTTFVYSLFENNYMDFGMELFNYFGCDKRMLECIAAVRLAIARRKDKNIIQREATYHFIKNYKER